MHTNENLSVVASFVQSLRQNGVQDICISPGSRSTPLTATMVREHGLRIWSLLDERSAGFFALGLAKVRRQPVVLVCTSGTATGNYLPAVMEAAYSEVPLILVTADRPPELRDVGSNQTVDQGKLYGSFVKWFYEMPVPEAGQIDMLHRHASQMAGRAVAHAMSRPCGPVHLNYPFREPLMPPVQTPMQVHAVLPSVWSTGSFVPEPDSLQEVFQMLSKAGRPLIVCGPQEDPEVPAVLTRFARAYGIPILADPLSQLRNHSATHREVLVDGYDLVLRSLAFQRAMRPDLVLRFGRTPTSKEVLDSLRRWHDIPQVVIHVGEGWSDPVFTATHVLRADIALFCLSMIGMSSPTDGHAWLERWQAVGNVARTTMHDIALQDEIPSLEGRLFLELAELLPAGSALCIGNSMPIRHADTYLPVTQHRIDVYGNRGVSGIDGVVSSAFGVAAGHARLTTLVIGDISMYHDLPGLLASMRLGVSLLIVLVNNDGASLRFCRRQNTTMW